MNIIQKKREVQGRNFSNVTKRVIYKVARTLKLSSKQVKAHVKGFYDVDISDEYVRKLRREDAGTNFRLQSLGSI
jgi:hypothetical protein